MEQYYKILGLETSASQQEIDEAYRKLKDELSPVNTGNQEFFKEELDKLEEAYKQLCNSNILATENAKTKTTNSGSNQTNTAEKSSENTDDPPKSRKFNKEIVQLVFLGLIVLGIWGIFLQNLGIIGPVEEYKQKVVVVNQVDTYSKGGEVEVSGTVGARIYDQVDININQIGGYRPWVNIEGDNAVLGVYTEDSRLVR
jgi:hypothetical protein